MQVPEMQMMSYTRLQEHYVRGHESGAIYKAMFDELFFDDLGSVASSIFSSSSTMSSAGRRKKRRRRELASLSGSSGNSSTSEHSYKVHRRIDNMFTSCYFVSKHILLSPEEKSRLVRELQAIWRAEKPTEVAPDGDGILGFCRVYLYCNVQHPPEPAIYGDKFISKHSILRSPRGLTYTVVHTDQGDSYGQIYLIIDFLERVFLFLRWFTPTFPGSNRIPPETSVVGRSFRKYRLTTSMAVISVAQVLFIICLLTSSQLSRYLEWRTWFHVFHPLIMYG